MFALIVRKASQTWMAKGSRLQRIVQQSITLEMKLAHRWSFLSMESSEPAARDAEYSVTGFG